MAAQPDRPTIQAHTLNWLAFLLGIRGDLDEARAMATVAGQQLAELGHELALRIFAAQSFGSIEAFAGNWDAAESNFGPALEYVAHWESTSIPPGGAGVPTSYCGWARSRSPAAIQSTRCGSRAKLGRAHVSWTH